MPDQPSTDVVVAGTVCQTCGGVGMVGRRWTNRPDGPGGRVRVRAAALMPCPACTAPREINER